MSIAENGLGFPERLSPSRREARRRRADFEPAFAALGRRSDFRISGALTISFDISCLAVHISHISKGRPGVSAVGDQIENTCGTIRGFRRWVHGFIFVSAT